MNNNPIKEVCEQIKEIYDKYKHMDHCLCDYSLITTFDDLIRYDMWQAIRTAMQDNLSKEKDKPDEL
jgi:hypothetical protein